jgi:hypothetical protein
VKKLFLLALLLPALALAISDMKWFDLNHWSTPFTNDGRWGYDATQSPGVAGGSWPRPLENFYVFGAGSWIGAIIPGTSPETLTTVMYNPNSGGTEAYPTLCQYWRGGNGDSLDRIYKYPGDWPPPQSRFPMAPQVPRSDMDMWSCFCDSNPANHTSPGRPLGIDVYLTVCGYDDSVAQDFFYFKYQLANSSGDSIHDAYFGLVLDPDIGDATDDLTALILDHSYEVGQETIRVQNTGFAYDNDNHEIPSSSWESGTPGAVAVMLLDSPESLGLTAFKKFTLSVEPLNDSAQYLSLAGYNYQTGAYEPYDSIDTSPGDRRMLLATGPFDLAPDSVLTFSYAVIGSPFGDSGQAPSERDTSELALRCKWAREYYEQLTGVAEQPPAQHGVQPIATVIRDVLFLPASLFTFHSSLFDMTGRRVMSLRPGANDVSALSPGVYFVREAQAQAQAQAMRKVVVAR